MPERIGRPPARRRSGLALAAALAASAAPASAEEPDGRTIIGVATMEADGTLVLRLRFAEGCFTGEAGLTYPPDHPDHRAVLAHVGAVEPGQSVPVRPWPSTDRR